MMHSRWSRWIRICNEFRESPWSWWFHCEIIVNSLLHQDNANSSLTTPNPTLCPPITLNLLGYAVTRSKIPSIVTTAKRKVVLAMADWTERWINSAPLTITSPATDTSLIDQQCSHCPVTVSNCGASWRSRWMNENNNKNHALHPESSLTLRKHCVSTQTTISVTASENERIKKSKFFLE